MTTVQITRNLSTHLEQLGFTEREVFVDYPLWESKRVWEMHRERNGLKGAPKLFTYPENQLKLNKSEAYTVGLTLQSADGAGVEACPWRGQCAEVCVLKNGNGRFNHVQHARNVKTQFVMEHPGFFLRLLIDELDKVRVKRPEQMRCRMNVNSDLRWYRIAPWFFERYMGGILFYDYTKNPAILGNEEGGLVLPNYLLVPSISENTNLVKAYEFTSHGGKVAVVTNRKKGQAVQPAEVRDGLFGHILMPWHPLVVDGDKTDDLWSHPEGSIIDLTAKGQARTLGEGFVRHVY
jgi:hypothetical protein